MTNAQEAYFINEVQNFLIQSPNAAKASKDGVINIIGYSNPNTSIIPVRVTYEDNPVDHIVIDYGTQNVLSSCNGINEIGGGIIRLNCDLIKRMTIGYIDYTPDTTITSLLASKFMP